MRWTRQHEPITWGLEPKATVAAKPTRQSPSLDPSAPVIAARSLRGGVSGVSRKEQFARRVGGFGLALTSEYRWGFGKWEV